MTRVRLRSGIFFITAFLFLAHSAWAEPSLNGGEDEFTSKQSVGDSTIPGFNNGAFDANGGTVGDANNGTVDGGFDADGVGDANSGLIDGRFSTSRFRTISLLDLNGNRVRILADRFGTFFDANGFLNFTFFDQNGQRITIRRINGQFVDRFGFFVRVQDLGNGQFVLRSFDGAGRFRRTPTVNGIAIRPFVVNRRFDANPVNNPPTSPQLQNVQLRAADPNNVNRFPGLRRFTDPTTGREFLAARDVDGRFKPLRLTRGTGAVTIIDNDGVERPLQNRASLADVRDHYAENQFNFPNPADRQLVSDVLNGDQIRAINNGTPLPTPPGSGTGDHGGGGGTGTGRPINPTPPPAGGATKFDLIKAEFQDPTTKRPVPQAVRDAILTENQRNGSTANAVARPLTCFNSVQKDQPKQMLLYLYRDQFSSTTSTGATSEVKRLSFQFSFGPESDIAKAMTDARPRAITIPETSPGADNEATKVNFNNATNTVQWEFNFKQARGSTDPLDQVLWIKKTVPGDASQNEILYCKRQ